MRLMKVTLSLLGLVAMLVIAGSALAQDASEPTTVTDDDVNAVADDLYCPVCENIPLDTCGTAACEDWRNEIRIMLEQGMNQDEITIDFVQRFGDRVVGTPQNPVLRALSLVSPYVLIAIGLFFGARFMINLRKQAPQANTTSNESGDTYYDILERDISS